MARTVSEERTSHPRSVATPSAESTSSAAVSGRWERSILSDSRTLPPRSGQPQWALDTARTITLHSLDVGCLQAGPVHVDSERGRGEMIGGDVLFLGVYVSDVGRDGDETPVGSSC